MKKRIIILAMVAVIAVSVVFTACNKDVYTDPSTGEEYLLVTDENGEKVLSADGELLVYVTNEDGKKVKDSDGNYETEVHGFVGQLENGGVVEDYAYYYTLPSGWKTVTDKGEFENKSKKATFNVSIENETYTDCVRKIERVYKVLTEQSNTEGEISAILKNEYQNEAIGGKVHTICIKYTEKVAVTLVFANGENTYQVAYETTRDITAEEAESEAIEMLKGFEFKPYAYYEGLTNAPTKAN